MVLKVGLVSLLALGVGVQAAEQPLRLGIEAAYPPFASKTPDNQIVGFDYDIGQALCAEMKVQCVWQEQEFDGLIPALKVKKVDAVISSMSMTPERMKSVDFSNRYYRIPARLVFKKGSGISDIPAQLKGKRIGVQRATNFDRYVTEKFAPAGAEVVRYGSQNEIFLDLLGGRLDATMASSVVIDESLLKRPTSNSSALASVSRCARAIPWPVVSIRPWRRFVPTAPTTRSARSISTSISTASNDQAFFRHACLSMRPFFH
jgi:arginine/ornithine transport system substrate-binding protein